MAAQAPIEYRVGLPEALRQQAALLYDEAFGAKLGLAIPDSAKRVAVLAACLQLDYAVGAIQGQTLLGIAGFRTAQGGLTDGGDLSTLRQELSLAQTARAVVVLALFERPTTSGQLLMDGLSVSAKARGQGVGTALLATLEDYARAERYTHIRLDVIDTNTAARRLYERLGFVAQDTADFEVLRGVLGFGASTTMTLALEQREVHSLNSSSAS